MMRAIIQLVDIYTMPNHSIYLIDEIENSMGIRSLPVMIDILFKFSKKIQFVFTTHHAYIFNNIDVGYWRILTREGVHIKVAHGDKLKEKFSKSYQEAYIQLLNSLSYKIILAADL
jgi:Fe-S cluster assembly ATPase SufC